MKTLTPLNKYHEDLQHLDFFADSAQAQAVAHLDNLYHRLITPVKPLPLTEWQRLWSATKMLLRMSDDKADIVPVKGLYFWGGVGRGSKDRSQSVSYRSSPMMPLGDQSQKRIRPAASPSRISRTPKIKK